MKHLGALEQLLMLATARLGDRAHGLAIRRELEELADREVSHGAVYSTMDRLVRQGLVHAQIGEEGPQTGGRRRRFYRLTPAGEVVITHSYRSLERLAAGALHGLGRVGVADGD